MRLNSYSDVFLWWQHGFTGAWRITAMHKYVHENSSWINGSIDSELPCPL